MISLCYRFICAMKFNYMNIIQLFLFSPCKLSKQQALILSSKRRLVPRANSFVTFCQLIKPEINRQDTGNLTTLYFYGSRLVLSIRVICLLCACYFSHVAVQFAVRKLTRLKTKLLIEYIGILAQLQLLIKQSSVPSFKTVDHDRLLIKYWRPAMLGCLPCGQTPHQPFIERL